MAEPPSFPPTPPDETAVTVTHRVRRLDWSLVRDAVLGLFDLDQGYLHTAWSFARRPAATFQAYLGAGRVHLANPLKLVILLAAATAFLSYHSGANQGVADGFAMGSGGGSDVDAKQAELQAIMDRYYNLIILGSLPVLATVTRMIYWRRSYNWLEHLALNGFVYVVTTVAFLVILGVAFAWPPVLHLYGPPAMAYQVWVYRRVLGGSWWPAILATLLGVVVVFMASTTTLALALLV